MVFMLNKSTIQIPRTPFAIDHNMEQYAYISDLELNDLKN